MIRQEMPRELGETAEPFLEWAKDQGGEGDMYPEERPLKVVALRWVLSAVIVVALTAGALAWSLLRSAGLASDLSRSRTEVRNLRAAGVEVQVARSEVGSLTSRLDRAERLLRRARLCISGLVTSLAQLVDLETEEGLSWWSRARPSCDRVMEATEG